LVFDERKLDQFDTPKYSKGGSDKNQLPYFHADIESKQRKWNISWRQNNFEAPMRTSADSPAGDDLRFRPRIDVGCGSIASF